MRAGCGCLLFILIVFPLLLIFIVLAGANTWILDRGFYQEVLSEPAFFETTWERAVTDWSSTNLPEAFGDVPPEALNAGLREVVTPEYLQSVSNETVNGLFDVLEGNATSFRFAFDLVPIREALQEDGAADFASAYVAALPVCRATQEAQAAEETLPACRPSDVSEAELAALVEEGIPEIAEQLPDEFVVNENVDLPEVQGRPLTPGVINTLMTTGLVIFGIVAVLVWLIDGFIGATTTRSRFLWLGFTLLIPAGLVLLAGITLNSPTLEMTIRESLLRRDVAQDAEMAASIATAAVNASDRVRTGFMIAGGIPTLVAVLLLIIGLATRPVDRRESVQVTYR